MACYLPLDRGAHLYPQPKHVLDLATPEACKAKLTYSISSGVVVTVVVVWFVSMSPVVQVQLDICQQRAACLRRFVVVIVISASSIRICYLQWRYMHSPSYHFRFSRSNAYQRDYLRAGLVLPFTNMCTTSAKQCKCWYFNNNNNNINWMHGKAQREPARHSVVLDCKLVPLHDKYQSLPAVCCITSMR